MIRYMDIILGQRNPLKAIFNLTGINRIHIYIYTHTLYLSSLFHKELYIVNTFYKEDVKIYKISLNKLYFLILKFTTFDAFTVQESISFLIIIIFAFIIFAIILHLYYMIHCHQVHYRYSLVTMITSMLIRM